MATEAQYAFFRSLYDEENARGLQLADKAKTNVGLFTLYSAFVLFVTEKFRPQALSQLTVFGLAVLSLLLGLVLALYVLKVAVYEPINDPKRIIADEYGARAPTDAHFYESRIADFTVAYERNSAVNDRKARALEWSFYFLVGGFAFQAAYFMIKFAN